MKYSDIILICIITIVPIYIYLTSNNKCQKNENTKPVNSKKINNPIIMYFDVPKDYYDPSIPYRSITSNKKLKQKQNLNPLKIKVEDYVDEKILPLNGNLSTIKNMVAKPWDTSHSNYMDIQDKVYNNQQKILNDNKNNVHLKNIIKDKIPISYGLFEIDGNMYNSLNYEDESQMVNYSENLNKNKINSVNNLNYCN